MASMQEPKRAKEGILTSLNNQTRTTMRLDRSISWFGMPWNGVFPLVVLDNNEVEFTHLNGGGPTGGSKGAVQYSGVTAQGVAYAWILAWAAPNTPTAANPNRVYGIGGVKEYIDTATWDQILHNLDTGANVPPSPAGVSASIANQQFPGFSTLTARFYLDL